MGGWDDFANNLATDLGPLISLFGEAPTKQYLSETLNFEEIVVFATAPIGILTAVVSVIRVCGSPSLRAFIGRAQEGEGNAEVELCSSVSRNVGELYNNGGIARIFGRPTLLEIVHDTEASHDEFYSSDTPTAGIHEPRDFFNDQRQRQDNHEANPESEPPEWVEILKRRGPGTKRNNARRRKSQDDVEKGQTNTNSRREDSGESGSESESNETNPFAADFAPSPNLTLNVGIKQRPRYWSITAAILGVVLQSAVLIWAALARYRLNLARKDVSDEYAVPMAIIGTTLLCFGVGLCAHMVERSTEERQFVRKGYQINRNRSKIYWLQPGGQKIGDQVFDCFGYTHKNLSRYVTSWKRQTKANDKQQKAQSSNNQALVWVAVLISVIGYVLQFLGLRACHSSVSVCQLGVMLVMSLVRAALRTERLEKEDNLMKDHPDLYNGHELDWLAFQLADLSDDSLKWQVTSSGFSNVDEIKWEKEEYRDCWRLLDDGQEDQMFIGDNFNPPEGRIYENSKKSLQRAQSDSERQKPHDTAELFLYRSRLAHLTRNWTEEQVAVRNVARRLAKAIEETAHICFKISSDYRDPTHNSEYFSLFHWPVECFLFRGREDLVSLKKVFLSMRRFISSVEQKPEWDTTTIWKEVTDWKVEVSELEAVLGLWAWSYTKSQRSPNPLQNKRINDEILTSRILWEDKNNDDEIFYPYTFTSKELEPWFDDYFNEELDWVETCHPSFSTGNDSTNTQTLESPLRLGWQNISKSSVAGGRVKCLRYLTRRPMSIAFAQEIYSFFFMAVSRVLKDIRGENTIEKTPETRYYQTKNSTISRIQNAFEKSGLGTRKDAIACIIPVLRNQGKLPSAMNVAATSHDMELVRLLKEDYDAEPDAMDSRGRTPLIEAVLAGVGDMIEPLLDLPCDPNKCDREGKSPLLHAVSGNRKDVVSKLLKSTATDRDLADSEGETPLTKAIRDKEPAMVQLLLEHNANPNHPGKDKRLPLDQVVAQNSHGREYSSYVPADQAAEDIVALLLKWGACLDGHYKKNGGWTPLHAAASYVQPRIMKQLLCNKALVNQQNDAGQTPLHVAASHNFEYEIFLTHYGGSFEPNFSEYDCQIESVKVLLEYGADPTIKDNEGNTPLYFAKSGSKRLMEEAIEKRNASKSKTDQDPSTETAAAGSGGQGEKEEDGEERSDEKDEDGRDEGEKEQDEE